MYIYMIVVTAFIVITTVMFIIISRRARTQHMPVIIAVAGGSLLAGLAFPALYDYVAEISGWNGDGSLIGTTFAMTMGVYIVVVFILALIIAGTVLKKRLIFSFEGQNDKDMGNDASYDINGVETADALNGGLNESKPNLIEQLYGNIIEDKENLQQLDVNSHEIAQTPVFQVDITEKSVDSEENIDKMGLENEITDISEFIEEAFRLKEQGDLEGAALYYMYVLDRKPSKQLIFWIVLDICVLYKELGQKTLAKDILSGYTEKYSDVMNYDVKTEIEKNLFM